MSARQFDPSAPEWMDLPQPESPELAADLANLVILNRVFGSHALVLRQLREWLTPGRTWRILDLATGAGDIPRAIIHYTRAHHLRVHIDVVDFQASTLAIAQRHSAGFPEITFHQADIRTFGDDHQWDIVLCSLALHHFAESDAVHLLRRAAVLATEAVLVSDLRRCTAGTLGVHLLTTLWMRAPMTRNDARISVRRAFSFEEMAALARRAGWRDFAHHRRFCFRQALALRKNLVPCDPGSR